MTTKREWLVQQGLAKATRGRLSLEAHAALAEAIAAGTHFSDNDPVVDSNNPDAKPWTRAVVEDWPVIRKSRGQLFGKTEEGWTVGFVTCRKCARHYKYCDCRPFGLPAVVASIDKRTRDILGQGYTKGLDTA